MQAGELTAAHLGRWITDGHRTGQIEYLFHDRDGRTFVQTDGGRIHVPHATEVQLLTLAPGPSGPHLLPDQDALPLD